MQDEKLQQKKAIRSSKIHRIKYLWKSLKSTFSNNAGRMILQNEVPRIYAPVTGMSKTFPENCTWKQNFELTLPGI